MKKVVKYNKLIRDRIPEIIKKAGWLPKVRTLRKNEFLKAAKNKVFEEAGELIKSNDKKGIVDEIVDIQELLDVLASEIRLTKSEIKRFQDAKRKKRGGFKKRLFLIKEEK
ncbi:MAG: nucleoside triphosphate pyrophosphohydrolase [Candidatus Pacebacteria bacterium]|nr:nucleoside triphosphate pyrophosphohydrolase [Candidatus Paceibacterota bacterium]